MPPANVQSVLNRLISLTNERDAGMLELTLAHALADLVGSQGDLHEVVVYRAVDLGKHLFSVMALDKRQQREPLSEALKQALVSCFRNGKHYAFAADAEPHLTLYPLKNAKNQAVAVIAVQLPSFDAQLHETITLLLQVYQNFSGLISDNEHDTLTGLLNRKTFENRISKVLVQMHNNKRREDREQAGHFLAIFDIDHFKQVNDRFGHLIGDEVLLMFSQLMAQSFRERDLLFRFGGEEFVGVFECDPEADIEGILDRFREKVQGFEFPQVGRITVSSGYTKISAYDVSAQLIDRADLALYYAKNNGRNRICHYEQLIASGALQEHRKQGDIELF